MNIQSLNSTSPNFTALKLTPASNRYLETLEMNELKYLQRVGREMSHYKYWDLEILGYGPVLKNRKNQLQVIADFGQGKTSPDYKRLFADNLNKKEIIESIEAKKTPLLKAIELTKQLERQSKYGPTGKEVKPVSINNKKDMISALITEFFVW